MVLADLEATPLHASHTGTEMAATQEMAIITRRERGEGEEVTQAKEDMTETPLGGAGAEEGGTFLSQSPVTVSGNWFKTYVGILACIKL